jgi:integrase
MTAAMRMHAVPAQRPGELLAEAVLFAGRVPLDEQSAVLASRIDPAFLAEAGWDAGTWVLTLPAAHPLLGRTFCRAPGCQTTCAAAARVCLDCQRRLTAAGLDLEDVALLPPPQGKRWLGAGDGTCRVSGCPRPWVTSGQPLCPEHLSQREQLGVSIADFTARADVAALPSHGTCSVASCPRQLPGHGTAYCDAHLQRLRALRRAGQSPGDETAWRATEPPVPRAGQVSLAGLAPSAAVEMLFGLQQRTRQGVKTYCTILRPVANDARTQQVSSLAELDIPGSRGQGYASVVSTMITHARRGASDPGTEIAKDTWDMALFGHRGNLSFTAITQPWLRETAKIWALADLPRRRGRSGGDKTRHYLSSVALLSASLRQRADHGEAPAALGRTDAEVFLNRLGYLHAGGEISELTRVLACREVRNLLTTTRQLGATGPGGPAAGLSDQFALHRDDMPDEPEHGEPGRDLPPEILRQACGHLETLASPQIRTAIEILIDTGRRPDDVVELPLDCLASDPGGSPVLVYDNHKAHRLGRRLPIPAATAALIRAQQQRVRDRFPGTPASELKLLPTSWANRDGRRPLSVSALSTAHREWLASLPPLLLDGGGEFDKDRAVPYSYRHTYAQRHADAGVPIDVLAELLDHRNLNVTRGYYRVGEERRRGAVDKVTAMQFDRHGNRTWRDARALLDDEHARYAVGSVAVPYGTCTEPSNVAAGGNDCPVRFRCADCDHFRTDVSYLPDLTAYLDDLLRTRERLAAATGIDTWARDQAAPADQEITVIRQLISRIKGDIAGLSPDDRARIDEAVAVVRKHRAVSIGMPSLRPAARPPTSQAKGQAS